MSQPTYTPYSAASATPQDNQPYGAQPYAAQQPYAATPVVYGAAYPLQAPEHPQAQMAMILGLVGLLGVQVCAPIAWWIASKAKKEIAAQPGMYRDGGTLQAGYVMGIIGTVLLVLTTLFVIGYFVFVFLILGLAATTS